MDMERKAARVLLEIGEQVPIAAPFFLRIFGKKEIKLKIHMPTADCFLRAVDLRLKMNVDDAELDNLKLEDSLELVSKSGKVLSRIVAIAILRTRWMDMVLGKWLARRLRKNIPFSELRYIVEVITVEGGLADFIHSIRLMKMTRLMSPNNLSQQEKGS